MKPSRRAFFVAGATALAAPALLRGVAARAQVAPANRPGPAFIRRKLGAFEITVLLDGVLHAGPEMMPDFDPALAAKALRRNHLSADAQLALPVLGFVINTGDRLVAIDAGTMPEFAPGVGGYHAALAEAGLAAEQIDTVLLTHLHPDHFGGLSDGDGSVRFGNADLVVARTEWDFWHDETVYAAVPAENKPFFDMARGFSAPYRDRLKLFDAEAEVIPGIQAVAMPGHTPGHVGYRIASQGQELLIWGDLIHVAALQFDQPNWTIVFDMDPDQTRKTRTRVLDMAADEGVMVAGSHLDFPGFGFVEKSGGYRFAPAPYDYML